MHAEFGAYKAFKQFNERVLVKYLGYNLTEIDDQILINIKKLKYYIKTKKNIEKVQFNIN